MRAPQNWQRWRNTAVVTNALVLITVAIYLVEVVLGGASDPQVLVFLGARYNPLIITGEYWRFFTPMFLHMGLMHIVVNMVALYYLGAITERIFGHWRFLVIYLVAGIAGNVASFVFLPKTLSAGASTAIFGLMGAFLMLGDSFKDNPLIRQLSRQFVLLAGINLAFNLVSSGVDIAGHIGGLIGGFLIAGAVGAPQLGRVPAWRQLLMGSVLGLALVALVFLGLRQ